MIVYKKLVLMLFLAIKRLQYEYATEAHLAPEECPLNNITCCKDSKENRNSQGSTNTISPILSFIATATEEAADNTTAYSNLHLILCNMFISILQLTRIAFKSFQWNQIEIKYQSGQNQSRIYVG